MEGTNQQRNEKNRQRRGWQDHLRVTDPFPVTFPPIGKQTQRPSCSKPVIAGQGGVTHVHDLCVWERRGSGRVCCGVVRGSHLPTLRGVQLYVFLGIAGAMESPPPSL